MNKPKTLQQAIIHFANPDNCLKFMVKLRWPNGVVVPHLWPQGVRVPRRISASGNARASMPNGNSPSRSGLSLRIPRSPLDKWLAAMWMIANCKNGISSYEVGRALGVTQKSAWFMLHRIRLAMQDRSFVKLGGSGSEVEVDETFIGGKARNMHADKARVGESLPLAAKTRLPSSAFWNVAEKFALP